MTIYGNSLQVIIGRESGNTLSLTYQFPQPMFYASAIHTFSFVYIADNGSGNSSLRIFWDGVSVGYVQKAHVPLVWDTSNGIYMGRYYNSPIYSTTYNAGLKVFTKALTEVEMLRQHTIFPPIVDKLAITTTDDVELGFTFENVNIDGFIIRINNMYPFNTENRSYKLGFRDRVTDLTDNSLFVDITKNLSTNVGPDTFNPYTNIPYDINVTRELYPELFPLIQHKHAIFLRLLDSDNNLLYQSLELVSPAYLVYDIYYRIYIPILRLKNYGDNLEMF